MEGGEPESETFETAYYQKYREQLRMAAASLGMSADNQATAYGIYQILGENLARYHGFKSEDLDAFLADPEWQKRIAKRQFYIMLGNLIKRRGLAWPLYIYSMWNAGVNYNESYSNAVKAIANKHNSVPLFWDRKRG